jgi:flagellar assembly protein FliH
MTIPRHIFDGASRVSIKDLDQQPVFRWIPPTIGKGGNLVQAEPREESVLRQAVAQVIPRTSGDKNSAGQSATPIEVARGFDEAREEGLMLGRQEGLQKGLEEGRRLGHAQGLEQGLTEGREQGRTEGYNDGLKRAENDVQQQLLTLDSIMTHLTHALNEQDYQLEQALLTLSKEIARHVIQRELMIDNSQIIAIVRQAIATLPASRDNVRILVNPGDVAIVERACQDTGESWRVVGSTQIARGGCRVETDQSVVDFTTGERFKQVLEQIVNRHLSQDQDQGAATVPPGEVFSPAPDPVIRARSTPLSETASATRSKSFAEEADSLAAATLRTKSSGPADGQEY